MKYSVHDTQEEAEAELERIEAHFNIPNSTTSHYAFVEEVEGVYRFRVKDYGPWKCDDIAKKVESIED
tara:strand:+ start:167 stop:370 length:204 start_codon:yes stop_codon:yes gene_type:complete